MEREPRRRAPAGIGVERADRVRRGAAAAAAASNRTPVATDERARWAAGHGGSRIVARPRGSFMSSSRSVPARIAAHATAASDRVARIGGVRRLACRQRSSRPRGGLAASSRRRQMKVFLDCESCFSDFLRSEIEFVDYVRDRTEAEVHVLITRAETGERRRASTRWPSSAAGLRRTDRHAARPSPTSSDTEDVVRRQLANALRVGLLRLPRAGRRCRRSWRSTVKLGSEQQRPAVAGDRWNNWVFSLRGSASFEGEESSRQRQLGAERQRRPDHAEVEDHVRRRDRSRDRGVRPRRGRAGEGRAARAGLQLAGRSRRSASTGRSARRATSNRRRSTTPSWRWRRRRRSSSTSSRTRSTRAGSCARCMRSACSATRYYEATLFGKTEETLPQHELSLTFEQRERWGSLEARTRVVAVPARPRQVPARGRGRDLAAPGARAVGRRPSSTRRASAISCRCRRAARPTRRSCCGCAGCRAATSTSCRLSLTYTFGSIFSSIVNPRFGQ